MEASTVRPCCSRPGHVGHVGRRGSEARTRHRAAAEGRPGGRETPWTIGEYITKRKTRETGSLGQILDGELLDPEGWNEDSKMRLAIDCVARELQVDEAHVRHKLELLQKLVPDLKPKLKTMKAGDMARLATTCEQIPQKMLTLREIFPRANLSRLVAAQPTILHEDMQSIRERARELKVLLETKDIDRTVELNPTFLDLPQVRVAIEEIKRLMPKENPSVYLMMNPSMLFSTQARDNMIEYDPCLLDPDHGDRPDDYPVNS